MFKNNNNCAKVSLAGIYNDTGPVDINYPFNLFSTIPVIGSCLTIPCDSFLLNKIVNISIHLHWDAQYLPVSFRDYYNGYNILPPYNNETFLVNIVLIKNHIRYLLNQKPISLFAEQEGKVLTKTVFSFDVKKFIEQHRKKKMARFLRKKSGSCIKLILVAPETAFGNILYAGEVTRAAVEMLKDPNRTLPMQPYNPRVQALEVVVA